MNRFLHISILWLAALVMAGCTKPAMVIDRGKPENSISSRSSSLPADNRLENLNGTWTVVSAGAGPGPVFISNGYLRITDIFTSIKHIELGPGADPRQIDLTQVPGTKSWSRVGLF